MDIKEMTLEQVIARMSELSEIASDVEKRNALTVEEMDLMISEKEQLEERKKGLEAEEQTRILANLEEVEKRHKKLDDIAKGNIVLPVIENKEERKMELEKFDIKSTEYRIAYFKKLAGETLNEVEERAFINTTANFGGALPVETLNEIWTNIEEEHPILGDISLYRSGTVLEVSVHTAIVAGDASVKAQGVAADDEENTFVKVTLSGKDFVKHSEISYALGKMSAGALESYLKDEIVLRIGGSLAADIIAQIVSDTAAGNKKTSAGLKVTTYAELNSMFALVKAKGLAVYANQATVYNYLTSIVDTTGRPVYQPSAQAGVAGFLIGAPVKVEDACSDNLFYIGAPKKVVGNLVQDIMIESDRDIKRHVDIHAGYARFECKLTKDTAFVVFTIKQA